VNIAGERSSARWLAGIVATVVAGVLTWAFIRAIDPKSDGTGPYAPPTQPPISSSAGGPSSRPAPATVQGLAGDPTAVTLHGVIYLVTRSDNGALVSQRWSPATSAWESWTELDGSFVGDPTAMTYTGSGGAVELYAIDNTGGMESAYNNGTGWSSWFQLGSTNLVGTPTAVQLGDSIFLVAHTNQGLRWTTWSHSWGTWQDLDR
jgi:hypothetical protein